MKTHFMLLAGVAQLMIVSSASADTVILASNNATIQPTGPRTGTNGKVFFNMEGSSNGSFASFGVIDFQVPNGVTFGPGGTLSLSLTQDNAAFTANGSLAFYVSTDTTTNIDPGSSPLAFDATASSLPTGIDAQLGTKYLLGMGTFAGVANGHLDLFSFTPTGAALSYLTTEIDTAGKVRLIVAPGDATVAATYSGFSNNTFQGPELTISATSVPEPSLMMLEAGLVLVMVCIRRRL